MNIFKEMFGMEPKGPEEKPANQILEKIDNPKWSIECGNTRLTAKIVGDVRPNELWMVLELITYLKTHPKPQTLNVVDYIQRKGLLRHFVVETII